MDDKIVEVVAREIGPTIRASILRGNACTHEEIDAVISGFARAAIAAYEANRAEDVVIVENGALVSRTRELEAALKPFADFAEKLDAKLAAKPMRSLGDNFYGIHIGTDFEAELTLTDLRRARAALAPDKA